MWGADRFVVGSAATARNLGVSPLVVGLTIVGFGTSAPEMLVSGVAAWTGNGGLSIGNALGSNITNVGLVLGAAAVIQPLRVHSKLIRREIPLLLAVMGVALVLMLDGDLGRWDGILLLAGMGGMIGWVVHEGLRQRQGDRDLLLVEYEEDVPEGLSTPVALVWFTVGLLVLLGGSRLLVWGADVIARHFGVSDLVIGLTVVALGTSLPELAASVTAALKDEHDIAVGNVVGSNMFNLLGVLGLPGVIAPGPFDPHALTRDFPVMVGLTAMLLLMARGFGERGRLTRIQGAILLVAFFGYLTYVYT